MITIKQNNIISVDDFGVNEQANTAIIDLLHKKKIDRVGVMIYEHISPTDIATLRESGIQIDLHLEIPILHKKKQMYGSVIGRGMRFVMLLCTKQLSSKALYSEWEKQVLLFQDVFGRMPDGLNSHENIHLFPSFFTSVCKLATQYNIPFVRCGSTSITKAHNLTRMILHILAKKDRRVLRNFPHITTTAYLASMDWFMQDPTQITQLPQNTEIICHPERPEEYKLLCHLQKL